MWDQTTKEEAMTEENKFVKIEKKDEYEQVVTGVAYSPPNVLDSDGEGMTAETIKAMAYDFMKNGRTDKIDIGHNFQESGAYAVESFIARKGDPGFPEGSWVLSVWCPDEIFEKVLKGELNGFSIGASASQKRARVLVEVSKEIISETKENTDDVLPKHSHQFVAYFDEHGKLIKGKTDYALEHMHEIKSGTRCEKSLGHSHPVSFEIKEE